MKTVVANQEPKSVGYGSDEQGGEQASDPATLDADALDQAGSHRSSGQSSNESQNDGAEKDSDGPRVIIAGRDGPQTGGSERGNPGVGG